MTRSVYFVQQDLKDAEVFYCENFFDFDQELYDAVNREATWESFPVCVMGKVFPSPRDNWYVADDKRPYKYAGFDRTPGKWTPVMVKLKKMLHKAVKQVNPDHPKLNACLANLYKDGEDYIGWHSDDEGDLHANAFIVSVSLGAERDFVFKHKTTGEKLVIPLKSGSVVLMGKNCQKNYKHTVPKRKKVKEPRINLTFRSILLRE